MNTIYRTIALLVIAAICFIAGSLAGRRIPDKGEVIVKTDTLTLRDTLRIPYPLLVDITISEDDIKVPIEDIIIRNDSLAVLPMEVKSYQGEGYRAQVSGYKPQLDWIEVFPQTTVITNTERVIDTRRHNICISAQMMYSDRFCTPALVSYEYNRKRFVLNAGAGYDFISNQAFVSAGIKIPVARW